MHFDHARLLAALAAAGDTTDAKIAHRLGVNPSTAWRLRNGVTRPAARTLAAIERAYGVTAAELYGGAA
ncbi:helix-turn-helix domain-containing protein [Streptomyces gilvosporeus]|uniref:HTH cro/C1-type domain-containing protein n=1 Tax=Streptomyces gilvosporeus TaxID=553510 RepID=A0A1V0TSQ6_9ACTN|nr:helix-turn-helix transcriptional regulator [Streptomyces gilvosporeus]ARF55976.1 hypothetical protein B1H19_18895 [Streptomyces gilvosporeus]